MDRSSIRRKCWRPKAERREAAEQQAAAKLSAGAGARRDAVRAGTRAAEGLAARRAVDHPRRGLLLRPAGPDQDHERGLGQLLALDDHDPPGPRAGRRDQLLRPPLRHAGQLAGHGSTPTSWGSSCFATSKTAGTRAASARNTTSATTWRPNATGTPAPAWAGKRSSRSAASTTT